jgi:hypothetical protein
MLSKPLNLLLKRLAFPIKKGLRQGLNGLRKFYFNTLYLLLNNPVVRHPSFLNDTPAAVFFTVFRSFLGSEEHAPIFQGRLEKSRGQIGTTGDFGCSVKYPGAQISSGKGRKKSDGHRGKQKRLAGEL